MSSQGSPYARFKGVPAPATSRSCGPPPAKPPTVRLDDALLIACLIEEQDGERFQRAAVRWQASSALGRPSMRIEDLRAGAVAFEALAANPDGARRALAALCARHGLRVAL